MGTKICKVDVVSVKVIPEEGKTLNMGFKDILKHPRVLDQEKNINGKNVNYSIIQENENYIIGFIRCILDKNLPAKINKETKETTKIDVKVTEGLVYGNIFLYSFELRCIFYEVNKDSIYLNHFKSFLFKCYYDSKTREEETKFDIVFGTVYKKKEYERALKMNTYKQFTIKVHQPAKLLKELKREIQPLEDSFEEHLNGELRKAASLNSDIAEITYNTLRPKKRGGLNSEVIKSILEYLNQIIVSSSVRENFDEIEIAGYTTDDNDKLNPINILGDVYSPTFKLYVPRLASDSQEEERKEMIINLYNEEIELLKEYL